MNTSRSATRGTFFVALLFLVPMIAAAQSAESELRTTIRAAIASDPRSASLSAAEIDSLVNTLAGKVQEEGIATEYVVAQQAAFAESAAAARDAASSRTGVIINSALLAIALLVLLFASYLLHRLRRAPVAPMSATPVMPASSGSTHQASGPTSYGG